MKRKYFILNENEEIAILNNTNQGILIKNSNNVISTSKIKKKTNQNLFIKTLNMSQLTNLVLVKLLEDNPEGNIDSKLIDKLLNKHFDFICGTNYNEMCLSDMYYQCITVYEKEKFSD